VTGLLLFPDGTGLLRVASGGAHILHPHHLRPLESIEAKPHQTLVGAALNHRFVALLFSHGRASADDPVRHEVRVLERRVRSRLSDLKLVETFTIARWPLAALELVDADGDDIVLWGEDWLVHYPSRREAFSVHELAIGTDRGRLPRARIVPRPSNATLLIVYGNGAAEELALDRSERTWLVEARGGRLDPLVDAGRRGPPHEAWLATRPGQLVPPSDGPRSQAARAGGGRRQGQSQ